MSAVRRKLKKNAFSSESADLAEQLQNLTLHKEPRATNENAWEVSLSNICARIADGRIQKIIVLTGAGISVSAGIPVSTHMHTHTHTLTHCTHFV
jgi:isochorismate synthase EntC